VIDLHKILYATISEWEIQERLRRDDFTFDAWNYIAEKIGHKNASTLRGMCQPRRRGGNAAKLGLEEAAIIMSITNDYRLLKYVVDEVKRRREQQKEQLNLFSEPLRTLESCYE
jgi:hypothetical protein